MVLSILYGSEDTLIKRDTKSHNSTLDIIRKSNDEYIDESYEVKMFDEAMAEYKINPTTYSLGEVEKELGL